MRLTMMCLRNLFRRRLRTTLSIVGISLTIMSLVAINTTTTTYVTAIKEMNLLFSNDIVVVARGVLVIQAFPIGGAIQENTVNQVKSVEGVKTATPLLFILDFGIEDTIHPVPLKVVIGMLGNWSMLTESTPLLPNGRWPSTNSTSIEVVVGYSLAKEHGLSIGSHIDVKNHVLNVVGILETHSALLSRAVIMPLRLAQDVYGYNMMINMIVVKSQENASNEELPSRIEATIPSVKALTSSERNEIVAPLLQDMENWILAITGILLFVAATIVTTVSIMSVSERRRDFATLDALGAPKTFIVQMIVAETGLMGLLGGIVGVVMGAVAAVFIVSFYSGIPVSIVLTDLLYVVPPSFVIGTIAITILVSCVAGLVAAIFATKAKIVSLLRSEY